MSERFIDEPDGIVKDNVTGVRYSEYDWNLGNITRLLNQINDRADKNAEELFELKRVLIKYEIKDSMKLDQVLREQRVW